MSQSVFVCMGATAVKSCELNQIISDLRHKVMLKPPCLVIKHQENSATNVKDNIDNIKEID